MKKITLSKLKALIRMGEAEREAYFKDNKDSIDFTAFYRSCRNLRANAILSKDFKQEEAITELIGHAVMWDANYH